MMMKNILVAAMLAASSAWAGPEQFEEIQKRRILLVEDDDTLRLVTEELLSKSWGADIVAAPTAERALEILAEDRAIDVVITDRDLGDGMDGVALAKAIGNGVNFLFMLSANPEGIPGPDAVLFEAIFTKPARAATMGQSIEMILRNDCRRSLHRDD